MWYALKKIKNIVAHEGIHTYSARWMYLAVLPKPFVQAAIRVPVFAVTVHTICQKQTGETNNEQTKALTAVPTG